MRIPPLFFVFAELVPSSSQGRERHTEKEKFEVKKACPKPRKERSRAESENSIDSEKLKKALEAFLPLYYRALALKNLKDVIGFWSMFSEILENFLQEFYFFSLSFFYRQPGDSGHFMVPLLQEIEKALPRIVRGLFTQVWVKIQKQREQRIRGVF